MRSLWADNSGFTLVEMLVAIMILAIGLLGLAELQVTAIKTNSHSQGMTAASTIAQQFLEDVVSWPEADSRLNADATGKTDWNGGTVSVDGAGTFNVTYDVDTDYQGISGVCLVTVHVANSQLRTMRGQGLKTVTMSTLKRSF